MDNTNAARAAQLGMPFGTANGRLRKMIMFKYVKLAGDDVCFKCGKQIDTIDELSIEHKLPWLSRDPSRFWDLDNIAFSHLMCNVPHYEDNQRKGVSRIEVPDGYARCVTCKQNKPVAEFWPDSRRYNGLRGHCKTCNSELRKQWRNK